ncbi:Multidrug-efflux transporter [Hartmannibacter diazotrophicus]|uniref:Multidrug-efflux transporter n=1 Tax=Hartmannibacter diazotrophicus TaxID=1482074 RepID=A0A2C9D769_9HYPH|nr:MATE family efflux transporter [Hartmannibacter diazotrophicus]SON56093.1 Multidrug-efflux transporter [Hartmannibacter diazotrophicus]
MHAPSISLAASIEEPATLRRHVSETLALALPIVLSRAGYTLLITTDLLAVGHVDALQLAGLGLGLAPQMTAMLLMIGALQATVLIAARTLAANRPDRLGEIVLMASLHGFAYAVLSLPVAWFSEDVFVLMGQDPALARTAGETAMAFFWGAPAFMAFVGVSMVIETIGRPVVVTAIILAGNAINIGFDLVFVNDAFGLFGEGNAAVAVGTSSIARGFMLVAAMAWLVRHARRNGDPFGLFPAIRRIGALLRNLGSEDNRAFRRLGLPLGLVQGIESAAFSAVTIIAGLAAPLTLAVHQAAMTAITFSFMTAVGYAGAASIRIARALGAGRTGDAIRAAGSAIALGVLTAAINGAIMAFLAPAVAPLLTSDPQVIAILLTTLGIAGILVVFDALMGVCLGVLRGMGDTWWPLVLQALAFWVFAVPLAYGLTVSLDWGPKGLLWAILAGVLSSSVLLGFRIRHRTGEISGA